MISTSVWFSFADGSVTRQTLQFVGSTFLQQRKRLSARALVMQTLKYIISEICCAWIIPSQYFSCSSFKVAQETYVQPSYALPIVLRCIHWAMARHFVLNLCIPKVFHYCFSFFIAGLELIHYSQRGTERAQSLSLTVQWNIYFQALLTLWTCRVFTLGLCCCISPSPQVLSRKLRDGSTANHWLRPDVTMLHVPCYLRHRELNIHQERVFFRFPVTTAIKLKIAITHYLCMTQQPSLSYC